MIAHYWIVYTMLTWRGIRAGDVDCWGNAADPNYALAGLSYPSESWLMIPPDNWECD